MAAYARPERQPRRLKCENGKFRLGQCVMTRGAETLFKKTGVSPALYLLKHTNGDWGNLCDADKQLNDEAVAHEGDPDKQRRVVSAYTVKGTKIWIITEWDRSVTTILLPQEY